MLDAAFRSLGFFRRRPWVSKFRIAGRESGEDLCLCARGDAVLVTSRDGDDLVVAELFSGRLLGRLSRVGYARVQFSPAALVCEPGKGGEVRGPVRRDERNGRTKLV